MTFRTNLLNKIMPKYITLKQGCVDPRLKSSLQKLYGHHHNLVDRYEISISQMAMDLSLFMQMFSFLYHCQDFYRI